MKRVGHMSVALFTLWCCRRGGEGAHLPEGSSAQSEALRSWVGEDRGDSD